MSAVKKTAERRNLIRKPRLSNQIYELLRSEIRSGKYAADTRFTEPAIAEELQTSRTPVREALFQLVNNGLLCEFDRGYGLPSLSVADVEDMMAIRISLETMVVRKLCTLINQERLQALEKAVDAELKAVRKKDSAEFISANNTFRELLYVLADNPYLKETAELYSDRLQIFRVLTLGERKNREFVAGEHKKLITAIGKHDEKRAVSIHTSMLKDATGAYIQAVKL